MIPDLPFGSDKDPVNCAPDKKLQSVAVPYSCKKEHYHQMKADASASVSAKRYIYVFTEPDPERYVPSAPELRNGAGQIRVIEVLPDPESEDAAKSDGYVGVAGEIKI